MSGTASEDSTLDMHIGSDKLRTLQIENTTNCYKYSTLAMCLKKNPKNPPCKQNFRKARFLQQHSSLLRSKQRQAMFKGS